MTDYQKRICDRIELHTFDITREMGNLLGKLQSAEFEAAREDVMIIHFYTLEIVRLHRKLIEEDL